MSGRPYHVLDTGALLAYASGSDTVGHLLADVSAAGARVAVPVLCVIEAYSLLDQDEYGLLRVLRGHPSVDEVCIADSPADDCVTIGSLARQAGRLGAGHAAFVGLITPAAVVTSRPDQIYAVLGDHWPVIEV